MTKKTPQQRIAELDKRKAEIEAKLKAEKESIVRAKRREQAKILNQKRKDDTRRKILLGAAIQNLVEQGHWQDEKIKRLMESFLFKEQDRKLFGLLPKND